MFFRGFFFTSHYSWYMNKSVKVTNILLILVTASCSIALLLFPIIWYCDSTQAVGWLPTCNRFKKSTKTKWVLQMSRRPHRPENRYSLLIRRETGKVCKKVFALGCLLQYIQSGQTQNECMLLKEEEDMLVWCCWGPLCKERVFSGSARHSSKPLSPKLPQAHC